MAVITRSVMNRAINSAFAGEVGGWQAEDLAQKAFDQPQTSRRLDRPALALGGEARPLSAGHTGPARPPLIPAREP